MSPSRTEAPPVAHRLGLADTARVATQVLVPLVAQGAVVRRPRVLALAERVDAARRANGVLADLRQRHGPGPVEANILGRRVTIPLAAEDVREILDADPTRLSPATREKRAALGHFEPEAVLVTDPADRAPRRALNEAVLDSGYAVHRLSGAFHHAVCEEARRLLLRVGPTGELGWETFHITFDRVIRRIVLGAAAVDDVPLTRLLNGLRSDGNWAYAHPRRRRVQELFAHRLAGHLQRADPDSLAGLLAEQPHTAENAAYGQVPHWLFAYDAAAIAAYNTLALLATHREHADCVRAEANDADPEDPYATATLAYLRSCVLEALRLWPTTLVILREDTDPGRGSGTTAIVSSFFHRDAETLPFADRFDPLAWSTGDAGPARGIVPFSAGPVACPGRNLVLFTVTALLATLLRERDGLRLVQGRLRDDGAPLPHTLDHTALRLQFGAA
ncbi:cytochrome P450 [Yinghuangia soli]|uniref:Cytochrome P450 n=1 Tax=Yinghuangia soli TaxID=2908204 RepID=A0AA41TZ65_9ACTN|nr:cytochrome P450 [Yinghuangia soli]MCF2527176.1 cytochrome P450 [Yinghuangia soli]